MRKVHHGHTRGEDAGWIDVVAPTNEEMEELVRTFSIPRPMLVHALDPDERPRVTSVGGATLVVLQVPYAQKKRDPTRHARSKLPFVTIPLGIIVAGNVVATVCARDNELLEELRRRQPDGRPHRLVLAAIGAAAAIFLAHLRVINSECDRIEEKLRGSMRNTEVMQLLHYQKSLIYYGTALRSYELLLKRLQQRPGFEIPAEDQDTLEDALVEIRQAIDVATVSGNILGEMMDAFASIINLNLNIVMKYLAAATIIVSIIPIVGTFYGMNVPLPGSRSPWAFPLLVGLTLALAGLAAGWLRRHRWI